MWLAKRQVYNIQKEGMFHQVDETFLLFYF